MPNPNPNPTPNPNPNRGERAVGRNVQLGELGRVQEERVRPAWVPGGGETVRSVPLGGRQRAAAAALRQAIGKRRGLSSRALRVGWGPGPAGGPLGRWEAARALLRARAL